MFSHRKIIDLEPRTTGAWCEEIELDALWEIGARLEMEKLLSSDSAGLIFEGKGDSNNDEGKTNRSLNLPNKFQQIKVDNRSLHGIKMKNAFRIVFAIRLVPRPFLLKTVFLNWRHSSISLREFRAASTICEVEIVVCISTSVVKHFPRTLSLDVERAFAHNPKVTTVGTNGKRE